MFTKITLKVAVMFVMFSLVGCTGMIVTDQTNNDTRIIDVVVNYFNPVGSAEAIARTVSQAEKEGWVLVSENEGRCVFRRK